MIAAMSLTIRPLEEADVDAADKVRRLAFGTYFGLPDPLSFSGTSRLVETRRRAWPDGALVAEKDGAIVGVAMSSRWGSLGLFGPLSVHPNIGAAASRAVCSTRRCRSTTAGTVAPRRSSPSQPA